MPKEKDQNLINKENKISPTEKLNQYIRIGSIGGRILIAVLVLAFVIMLVWGLTGSIPISFTEKCVISWGKESPQIAVCFVDVEKNPDIIQVGKPVSIKTQDGNVLSGEIVRATEIPLSRQEVIETFPKLPESEGREYYDWALDNLLEGKDYVYIIIINVKDDVSNYNMAIGEATVVIGEVKPISFLMR